MRLFKAYILGFTLSFSINVLFYLVLTRLWLGPLEIAITASGVGAALHLLLFMVYAIQLFYFHFKRIDIRGDFLWTNFYKATLVVYGVLWIVSTIASGDIVMFPAILFLSIPYLIYSIASMSITVVFLKKAISLSGINKDYETI